MRYDRGEILGLFCGELGIRPSARVIVAPGKGGLRIWDLSAGIEFTLNSRSNALNIRRHAAPLHCVAIFQESDEALLARIANRRLTPWSEERETIFSELRYRRLPRSRHRPYRLRPVLSGLVKHLFGRR